MRILNASAAEFLDAQEKFDSSNFLQSNQIYELQQERNRFLLTERLLILNDNEIVGLAIVNYRKKWKFFKEAIIVQGPVLDYSNITLVINALNCLERHIAQKNAISVMCHPYLIRVRKSVNQEIIKQSENDLVIDCFKKRNYYNSFDPNFLLDGLNQAFIKDLSDFKNYEDVENRFSPSLKRNIKKFKDSHVFVSEFSREEIPLFYDILLKTSDRKAFAIPDIDLFYKLKDKFKSKAKFMYAYLDCNAYLNYLNTNISILKNQINDLYLKSDSKKRNMSIKNSEQQLKSFEKRLREFMSYDNTADRILLSSYLFIQFGDELTSYFGGNIEKYFIFGGATLINCDMLKFAKENNLKYFNFGGTIETDQSSHGIGNFKYKKQFDGQLVQYLGSFTKPLSIIGKLLFYIKNIQP